MIKAIEYRTHPEQWREWPNEAAATITGGETVPIPLDHQI